MTPRTQSNPKATVEGSGPALSPRAGARTRRRAASAGGPSKARRTPAPRTGFAWRGMVPERVEAIAVVHRALDRLEGSRGAREVEEALSRLSTALESLGHRVSDAEDRTRAQASAQLDGVRSAWQEWRDALLATWPAPATEAFDTLLQRIGLMRFSQHQRALEVTRKNAQRAGARKARAAMRRAREAEASAAR